MEKKKFLKELTGFTIMEAVILVITVFPFFKHGLSGYAPDLQYHLLRIEGVKEAILSHDYPCRIYHFFYADYGYGSPMFYPDIFLLIPAVFRIAGLSPLGAYKLFCSLLCILIAASTYFSFRYISRNHLYSMVGTGLVCLSQFYLADLHDRVGMSEYQAYIFLPVLVAALYDLFVLEGKKIYLFGIAFCGLIFSHAIMTFLSAVFVILIFFTAVPFKIFRKKLSLKKIRSLIVCAVISFGVTAYYLVPMVEQLNWNTLKVSVPWAHPGDYMEPASVLFRMTGYFNYIAYVGIGLPIIMGAVLFAKDLFLPEKNPMAKLFLILGILLFAVMTPVFPWKKLDDTIFNMIQFTYRIYPFAIISTVTSVVLFGSDALKTKHRNLYACAGIILLVLSCAFGIIQNRTVEISEDSLYLTEEYLSENDNITGSFEWLPLDIDEHVLYMTAPADVVVDYMYLLPFCNNGHGNYSFVTADGERHWYLVPLVAYKGYKVNITTADGNSKELPIETELGKICFTNDTGLSGVITVEYKGTLIQKISDAVSVLTVLGLAMCFINFHRKNKKKISE